MPRDNNPNNITDLIQKQNQAIGETVHFDPPRQQTHSNLLRSLEQSFTNSHHSIDEEDAPRQPINFLADLNNSVVAGDDISINEGQINEESYHNTAPVQTYSEPLSPTYNSENIDTRPRSQSFS